MENEVLKAIEALATQMNSMQSVMSESIQRLENGQQELKEGQLQFEDGQRKLENGQQELRGSQQKLEDGQQKLESGQQGLIDDVRRIKFLMEHELPTQIKQLAEGHQGLLEHLPDADAVEDLNIRVSALETVTKQNSDDIQKLKAI